MHLWDVHESDAQEQVRGRVNQVGEDPSQGAQPDGPRAEPMTAGDQPDDDEDPGDQFTACEDQTGSQPQMPASPILVRDLEPKTAPTAARERLFLGVRNEVKGEVAGDAAQQRCAGVRRDRADKSSNEQVGEWMHRFRRGDNISLAVLLNCCRKSWPGKVNHPWGPLVVHGEHITIQIISL